MKKSVFFLLFLSILLTLSSCKAKDWYLYTSFHEPATDGLRYLYSEDGQHWDSIPHVWLSPQVGRQRVMRDPSISQTPDGVYHLVWTSSWKGDLGFGYAQSKDLIQWSEERFIKVMDDTTTVNVWAPELFYDEETDSTMIVWASCVPYRFEKGIEDEFNNHRLYYTMTKDFIHFSPTRLLIDPGFSCIDAILIHRSKSDYVMVLKDNTRPNRNLKVAFSNRATGPWHDVSATFSESFAEGPSFVKLPMGYVIYYDRYQQKDFGAVLTTDFKHFEDISHQVRIPELHKHGTIIKVPKKTVSRIIKASRAR